MQIAEATEVGIPILPNDKTMTHCPGPLTSDLLGIWSAFPFPCRGFLGHLAGLKLWLSGPCCLLKRAAQWAIMPAQHQYRGFVGRHVCSTSWLSGPSSVQDRLDLLSAWLRLPGPSCLLSVAIFCLNCLWATVYAIVSSSVRRAAVSSFEPS